MGKRQPDEETAAARRRPRGAAWMTGLATIAGACTGGLVVLASCGGTTGQNGPPPGATNSGMDATVIDAGARGDDADESFDTSIQYTDRALPDVGAPGEGGSGGDAGGELPFCPPDIPAVFEDAGIGTPIYDGSVATYELPAVFTAGGGTDLAPPGSPCASQVYLGSSACDECVKEQSGGLGPWTGAFGTALLPPCSDLWDAGSASVGPGAGLSRHDLCVALYECILTTGCWLTTPGDLTPCTCNPEDGGGAAHCIANGGDGPCWPQELAALETPAGTSFVDTVMELNNAHSIVGHAGGGTNAMFQSAGSDPCGQFCTLDAGK